MNIGLHSLTCSLETALEQISPAIYREESEWFMLSEIYYWYTEIIN